MTKENFDKELGRLNKFVELLTNIKKQQSLSLKKGSNTEETKKEIEENLQNLEELLTNLNIMAGLIVSVQKQNNEEQKEIVYKNAKSMLKEMKNILAS